MLHLFFPDSRLLGKERLVVVVIVIIHILTQTSLNLTLNSLHISLVMIVTCSNTAGKSPTICKTGVDCFLQRAQMTLMLNVVLNHLLLSWRDQYL